MHFFYVITMFIVAAIGLFGGVFAVTLGLMSYTKHDWGIGTFALIVGLFLINVYICVQFPY